MRNYLWFWDFIHFKQLLSRGKDHALEINLLLFFLSFMMIFLSLDTFCDHIIEFVKFISLKLFFVVLIVRLNIFIIFLKLIRCSFDLLENLEQATFLAFCINLNFILLNLVYMFWSNSLLFLIILLFFDISLIFSLSQHVLMLHVCWNEMKNSNCYAWPHLLPTLLIECLSFHQNRIIK